MRAKWCNPLIVASGLLAQACSAEDSAPAGRVLEEETRLTAGACITPDPDAKQAMPGGTGPRLLGVLPAIVGKLGLDFAANALKSAGQSKTVNASPAFPLNTWMYQLRPDGGLGLHPDLACIQLVAGSFGGAKPALDKPLPDMNEAAWHELVQRIRPSSVRFFFELGVRRPLQFGTDKPGLFTLAPRSLYFAGLADSGFFDWFGKPRRSLAIAISIRAEGDADAVTSAQFAFPGVRVGTHLGAEYFRGLEAAALAGLPLEEEKATQAASQELVALGSLHAGKKLPPNATTLPEPKGLRKSFEAYCAAHQALETTRLQAATAAGAEYQPELLAECPVDQRDARWNLAQQTQALATQKLLAKAAQLAAEGQFAERLDCKEALCSLKVAGRKPIGAVTISATLSEVREARKFVEFLGKVAEELKPELEKRLDGSAKKAKAEAQEFRLQLQETYQLALLKVTLAQQAVNGASAEEKGAAEFALLQAKIDANRAARALGLSEPYAL
ncbi:MAG: hypothetical protein U1E77_14820 [Inhella sp.]